MKQIKHKLITKKLLEDGAKQFLKGQLKANNLLMTSNIPNLDSDVIPDKLLHTLESQYSLGILGHFNEDEIRQEDFESMEFFSSQLKLYASSPLFNIDDNFVGVVETVKFAARARLKLVIDDGISMRELFDLDDGFEYTSGLIELRELAAIADMSVQSVRNDNSKSAAPIKFRSSEGKHYTSVAEAKNWLKQRNSFKPTINFNELHEREQRDNTLYVPVAKDGTHFSSTCRMTRGYQIGEKGAERYIESFSEARSELLFMPQAKWRRPNEKGNFGIVSAVEWKFLPKGEVLKD